MRNSPQNDLVSQIEHILELEHDALINGKLDDLAKLLEKKQMLIEALSMAPFTGLQTLKSLQAKAVRNQAMLESATRGIKTVASRLSTLQKVRRSLETYDANGQKKTIRSTQKTTFEKRA